MNDLFGLTGAHGSMLIALIALLLAPSTFLGVSAQDATLPVLVGGSETLQERLEYPEEARARGIGGQVLLAFMVHEDGSVSDIEVVRSPDPLLSEAAVEAIENSRFEPATRGGRPISVRHQFSVSFALQQVARPPAGVEPDPDTTEIIRYRDDAPDTMPVLIGGPKGFPDQMEIPPSQRRLAEGRVFLEFLVNEDGSVSEVEVTRSPHPLYSEAAVQALEESRFQPGFHDGRPVRVRHHMTVSFGYNPEPPMPSAPEPIGGMAQLKERVTCPSSLRGEDISGRVSVRFDLDRDGQPVDISIRRSPDERVNASVIETIEESRWTRSNDLDRETVQVRFALNCTD